jgi:hypothetical protein
VNDLVRQHAVVADSATDRLELGLLYRSTASSAPATGNRTSLRVNGKSKDATEAEEPPPPAQPTPQASSASSSLAKVPIKVTTRVFNTPGKLEPIGPPSTAPDGGDRGPQYAIKPMPGLNVVEIVAGAVEAEEVYRVFVSV